MPHESPESKLTPPATEEVVSAFKAEDRERAIQLLSQWQEAMQIEAGKCEHEYSRLEYNIALLELMVSVGLLTEVAKDIEDAWEMMTHELTRMNPDEPSEELRDLYNRLTALDGRLKPL